MSEYFFDRWLSVTPSEDVKFENKLNDVLERCMRYKPGDAVRGYTIQKVGIDNYYGEFT